MTESIFLTIAHNIYLTREERYKLNEPDVELEVVGITLPVWIRSSFTSEPAEEVISKYKLRNFLKDTTDTVVLLDDGFIVSIDNKETLRYLYDRKDGGNCSIYMTYQNRVQHKTQEVSVIHYINIQDVSVLGEIPTKGNQ